MDINYIYNRTMVMSCGEKKRLKRKELNEHISLKNMLMVAPKVYVNTNNIKEIDFVNSVIIFENGEKIDKITKKIFI